MNSSKQSMYHPRVTRRVAVQAGSISLLGMGVNHLDALRAAAAPGRRVPRAKSVIFIFLSGGLAQQDSFDPKPTAPDKVRGEFKAIATGTAGIHICEHLPLLAQRSEKWALVRSLTHPYNEHSQGHMVMLSGRTPMPTGFDASKPKPTDWPSIAAVTNAIMQPANNLPPAVILPERLIHRTGRVIPGQFAGLMGSRRTPWILDAIPFNAKTYGAYPDYEFHHERGRESTASISFQAPHLTVPEGLGQRRLGRRLDLIKHLDRQRRDLDLAANVQQFDRYRQSAISLMLDPNTRRALDIDESDPKLDQYGKHSFGKSLLLARQLVASGVSLVQVNLGNNETWDTHQAAFPNLKKFLLPPMDQSVSALLDDLDEEGLLNETLVVMAGEFGRTPRIFNIPGAKLPGRDHWGAVQTVFFAGGGVRGGTVVGSSDRIGGYPASDPQNPENMAATIYSALGIPRTSVWRDDSGRPHHIYFGQPISGLV